MKNLYYLSTYKKLFLTALTLCCLVAAVGSFNRVEAQFRDDEKSEPAAFGGEYSFPDSVCLTDFKRAEIQMEINKNIENLKAEGKLPESSAMFLPPLFTFPVRGNGAAINDPGVHGISNFVDQNPAFPNQTLDYNCGTRTYDQSSGYNHKGVDIFTFPFPWNKMDNNEVAATAAADGIIISKSDGNFDRSCSFNSANWNAVFIRHSDGTVSWYGHLKNGSLTTKAVGASVTQGEYLGIVGSSGNSSGPHLHFEIYNASNQLQDPYQGACNTMNATGYWLNQLPYRDSKINKLMTHSAPPNFSTCPNPEIQNKKDVFLPGEQIFTAGYFHDQSAGQVTQYSILRPDGSVFTSWSHTSPNTYNASYWYWTHNLPANAPNGTWKFRAVFQSQTYEHTFRVGTANRTQFDYDGDKKADISVFRPSTGGWYLLQSSNSSFFGMAFGSNSDLIAPADYDGDGKTDVAVFRPASGIWYLQQSANGFTAVSFGQNGDIPVPADYDGDGKADIALFRPSDGGWYRLNSSNGAFAGATFGASGDKPTIGDFDGDGKSDIAVYRPSTGSWYRLNSSTGQFYGIAFGAAEDIPTPADYDGDGKTDVSVFRPSNGGWYRYNSSNGSFAAASFGVSGDKPVAADYDGDGKADIAVYRPSNGNWYLQRSSAGFTGQQFGVSEDIPIPNAFLR